MFFRKKGKINYHVICKYKREKSMKNRNKNNHNNNNKLSLRI